eukprot:2725936-Amphidinium_carterae.1
MLTSSSSYMHYSTRQPPGSLTHFHWSAFVSNMVCNTWKALCACLTSKVKPPAPSVDAVPDDYGDTAERQSCCTVLLSPF